MPVKSTEKRPQTVNVTPPGGWNPDASEAAMPKSDFLESRNWRKPRADVWEVRSGIKRWYFPGEYPVGAAEYQFDETYIRILFFEDSDGLKARAFDGAGIDVTIGTIAPALGSGLHYEVDAVQFNTYMILTVYNVGVFAIFPTVSDLTGWAFLELEKTESPTPNALSYAAQVTGDLILYQYITPPPNGGTDCKGLYDLTPPATGVGSAAAATEPIKLRIPMAAPYFRVGDSGADGVNLQSTNLVKQFEPESVSANYSDANVELETNTPPFRALGTKYHIQKRGWFYKFIIRSEFTDVRGQKHSYYQAPSVDIFVPDNDYAPPFVCRSTGGIAPYFQINHTIMLSSFDFAFDDKLIPEAGEDLRTLPDFGTTNPFSAGIYENFIKQVKNYFHDNVAIHTPDKTPVTQDPYYFLAVVLGYNFPNTASNPPGEAFWYIYPYKTSVPISELLGAPQTVFNWSDFTLPAETPGDSFPHAVEIEIYRTAHTDNPLYAPNIYGYAGSLTKPSDASPISSFTDSTADWNLDFNRRTDSEVGFLEGESSGKVIRVYNNNIRLGDTVTHLKIRKPSKLVQAFAFDPVVGITGGFLKTDLNGLPNVAFAYQYVDNNGYVSELTTFPIDTSGAALDYVSIAFTFPHGYNDTINKIYLFEGRMVSGVRVWKRARGDDNSLTIDPKDGHFIYNGYIFWDLMPEATPASDIISKDRGACTWSEGADMFLFPPVNFELEHEFAPVTHIASVVGPALILMNRAVVQTTFGVDNRWEEIHDRVGCISRQAAIRVGKVEFFLSSSGLMLAEGYSIRPFPASLQRTIREYLAEEITGQQPLANASRASVGWDDNRHELWLHFPSSVDLGGVMPAANFVYRMFLDYGDYTGKYAQNYLFDLVFPDPDDLGATVTDGGVPAYFISSASGKLYALIYEIVDSVTRMTLIDCDSATEQWGGDAYLTLPFALGRPSKKKALSELAMFYDRKCYLDYATGMRRTDGVEDDLVNGLLKPACTITEVPQESDHYRQNFSEPIESMLTEDIEDYTPLVRLHTKPDSDGDHFMSIQSISMRLNVEEDANVADT